MAAKAGNRKLTKTRKRKLTVEYVAAVVAIDSNFEPVTSAGFNYRQKNVYPYLEAKGFNLVRCQGQLARRYYVVSEVIEQSVEYITGVGHGSADSYTGDQYDIIFQVGSYNSNEVNPKIVHFLSCQTAKELGPDFVKHGCHAYFGYDIDFTFPWDYADIFFECDSEIDRAFADGLKAKEVYTRVKALFEKYIDSLDNAGKHYVASILETDLAHLCSPSLSNWWGSEEAKLD